MPPKALGSSITATSRRAALAHLLRTPGPPFGLFADATRILVGSSVTVRVLPSRLQCPAMHYLTAAGVGVLTGIATAILWIVVRFILPIAMSLFLSRLGATESGSGGAGAVIGSGSILLAALLGFVGGLVWIIGRG